MADRVFWKGYLKLSLVTCPVSMSPATSESEKLRFHTLNRSTGNRVVNQYVDCLTGKRVAEENQVKGYERGEGDYIVLEDEELDSVALESTHTIDIEKFARRDDIGWVWYDRPHYLMPRDTVGEEAFSVIRDAMEESGTVGISRLVLYRRERAVMIAPRDKGMVLWTLRYGDEVRDDSPYFADIPKEKLDAKLTAMMKRLITEKTQSWDPSLVRDPVQERLMDIIAAKKKGKLKPAELEAPREKPATVVNISDALRISLSQETSPQKRR